jgi:cyclase
MRRVRVIPTLLLDNKKFVKTSQFKEPQYIGDPINTLRILNDKEVDEICVLDIYATRNSAPPDLGYIKLLTSECFMPLCYGGGITTIDQALAIFRSGVEKIILGTAAFKNEMLLTEIAKKVGTQSAVVSIDIKKDWLGRFRVFVNNGRENTSLTPSDYAERMEQLGAGELLIQNIDREGAQTGYCIECIHQVAHRVKIPVIASGGAATIEDFLKGIQAGASAIAAGSMFVYKGSRKGVLINYPDQKTLTEKLYAKL